MDLSESLQSQIPQSRCEGVISLVWSGLHMEAIHMVPVPIAMVAIVCLLAGPYNAKLEAQQATVWTSLPNLLGLKSNNSMGEMWCLFTLLSSTSCTPLFNSCLAHAL